MRYHSSWLEAFWEVIPRDHAVPPRVRDLTVRRVHCHRGAVHHRHMGLITVGVASWAAFQSLTSHPVFLAVSREAQDFSEKRASRGSGLGPSDFGPTANRHNSIHPLTHLSKLGDSGPRVSFVHLSRGGFQTIGSPLPFPLLDLNLSCGRSSC